MVRLDIAKRAAAIQATVEQEGERLGEFDP
jgi:hypothetical protein